MRPRLTALLALFLGLALAAPAAAQTTITPFDGGLDPTMSPLRPYYSGSGNSVTLTSNPACNGNASKLTIGLGSGTRRAQLDGAPNNQPDGSLVYTGWSTFVPADYPNVATWHALMQWFSAPFSGSPPVAVGISGSNLVIHLHTNGSGKQTVLSVPLVKGVWHDLVMLRRVSKSASTGYIEFWLDGVQQTFTNGSQRRIHQTMNSDTFTPNRTIPTHYTGTGNGGTIYHDEIRDDNSFEAVATNCRGAEPTATPIPATPTQTPTPTATSTPPPTPPPTSTSMSDPDVPITAVDFAWTPARPWVGEATTFTVTVQGGNPPFTYDWLDDGPDGPGRTDWDWPCEPSNCNPHTRSFASTTVKHPRVIVSDADGDTLGSVHDHARHDVVVSR